jgi:hypothetical protein
MQEALFINQNLESWNIEFYFWKNQFPLLASLQDSSIKLWEYSEFEIVVCSSANFFAGSPNLCLIYKSPKDIVQCSDLQISRKKKTAGCLMLVLQGGSMSCEILKQQYVIFYHKERLKVPAWWSNV